jgi:hypothetical protein
MKGKTETDNAFRFYNIARNIGSAVRGILVKTHPEFLIFLAETYAMAGIGGHLKSLTEAERSPLQNKNNCGFASLQSHKMKTSEHRFITSFDLDCVVRLIILKCKSTSLKIIPVLG